MKKLGDEVEALTLGEAIRLVRTVKCIRQADFAKYLNITATALSKLESSGNASVETIIRFYYILQKFLEKQSENEVEIIQNYAIKKVKDKIVYPLIQDVLNPDMEIFTEGNTFADTIEMARDAIAYDFPEIRKIVEVGVKKQF
ncbi:MAG: helix-turn-helix domain-containing protein [Lachnospiraceae bacterium]|nr:helix-turn-helix domain-containing protein [Lachnospiraceae bacterium]